MLMYQYMMNAWDNHIPTRKDNKLCLTRSSDMVRCCCCCCCQSTVDLNKSPERDITMTRRRNKQDAITKLPNDKKSSNHKRSEPPPKKTRTNTNLLPTSFTHLLLTPIHTLSLSVFVTLSRYLFIDTYTTTYTKVVVLLFLNHHIILNFKY